jgi:tetratricopeptide (TPR) repeat protein
MSFSKGFLAAAQPAQVAVNAVAAGDAAAAAAAKPAVDAAVAAVENEDDRLMAGQLLYSLAGKSKSQADQLAGLKMMIQSGKADASLAPQINAAAGQLSLSAKDYAGAQTYLQQAIDLGYSDASVKVLLGETYIANNQVAKGMGVLKSAITSSKASGTAAPESWYKRGLASAFKAKSITDAADFGALLIQDHPQPANVGIAATIVRELGNFGAQETLDLMRLMGRTKSYAEPRDYVEYIQASDPRRYPGETLEVIEAGLASGKLKTSDTFVSDARTQATGRLAADKASLAGYEADARKSGATEATLSGAADALLSYGKAAQAEDLFNLSLGKPGVDTNRAYTRLGIAQIDQGKFAEAQASFGKVTGPRQPIAKLWGAYAASKANPAPAAAAPRRRNSPLPTLLRMQGKVIRFSMLTRTAASSISRSASRPSVP